MPSSKVKDTERIVSLRALGKWRPPRWFMQSEYGFLADGADASITLLHNKDGLIFSVSYQA